MSKYSLILSQYVLVKTKIPVFELCKNDESIFKSFFEEVENDELVFNDLVAALNIVQRSANNMHLPKTQFRPLKGLKVDCKVYEAKKNGIRIYLFHEKKTGRIIVTGGKKDNQDADIKTLQKIIKAYFNEK